MIDSHQLCVTLVYELNKTTRSKTMTKLLMKNGKVAVAVSGGWGAGWSTWNDVSPLDARFNKLFDEGKHEEAAALCEKLDLGFSGGAVDVDLEWVDVGTKFIVEEYDGSETLRSLEELDVHCAQEE